MRPRTLALFIFSVMALVAWLGLTSFAWSYDLSFPEAVQTCVGYTNSRTNRNSPNYRPFDAFSIWNNQTGRYKVETFGTLHEVFIFKKCMNEVGHPLDPLELRG